MQSPPPLSRDEARSLLRSRPGRSVQVGVTAVAIAVLTLTAAVAAAAAAAGGLSIPWLLAALLAGVVAVSLAVDVWRDTAGDPVLARLLVSRRLPNSRIEAEVTEAWRLESDGPVPATRPSRGSRVLRTTAALHPLLAEGARGTVLFLRGGRLAAAFVADPEPSQRKKSKKPRRRG